MTKLNISGFTVDFVFGLFPVLTLTPFKFKFPSDLLLLFTGCLSLDLSSVVFLNSFIKSDINLTYHRNCL